MVALVMKPGANGDYWIDVVRSIELRSDYERMITPKSVLWVNKEKNPSWRLGTQELNVLSAASKDGFIRKITYEPEIVNAEKKSLKDTDTMDFFAQMSSDEYVRDAGKLINKLEEMRKKTDFTRDAWRGRVTELSKQLLEETHSSMHQDLQSEVRTRYGSVRAYMNKNFGCTKM